MPIICNSKMIDKEESTTRIARNTQAHTHKKDRRLHLRLNIITDEEDEQG